MKIKAISYVGCLLLLLAEQASAGNLLVSTRVNCPSSVTVGQNLTVDVHLENSECTSVNVRFFSAILGNADESVGGFGIHGPNAVGSPTVVSAGTCPFIPGVLDLMLAASPVAPTSLQGKVATYLLISEWESGTRRATQVDHCLVEVLGP
jgi:hypothetical protein